jgi:cell division protein FtsL
VLLTALLFITMFALAVAHTVLVQGQVRLDAVDAQLAEEQARYQELRQEVAAMESPERIVAAAHDAGMVTPDDLVYLQPTATDAADTDTSPSSDAPDDEVASTGSWPTVKPMLESPTP